MALPPPAGGRRGPPGGWGAGLALDATLGGGGWGDGGGLRAGKSAKNGHLRRNSEVSGGLRRQNARAVTVGILVTWENARPDRSGAPSASEFRRKCPKTRKECARPPSIPLQRDPRRRQRALRHVLGERAAEGPRGGRASAAVVRGLRGGRASAAAVREGGGMRSGAPPFPADLPRSRRLRVGRALAGRVLASRQEAGARAPGAFSARPGCTQNGEDGHRRRSRAGRASGSACVRCEI